jgi:hypothetical protein
MVEPECDGKGAVKPAKEALPLAFRLHQPLTPVVLLEKRTAFVILDLIVGVSFIASFSRR